MSVRYQPVGWNRTKRLYDAAVIAGVALYLAAFLRFAPENMSQTDARSLEIKAWGTCAFLLLTLTLAIGPLARLDRRFLPLLYNRRHIGVITATVATVHAAKVLGWYFAYSPVPPFEALLGADASYGQFSGFPFIPFGIGALLILWVMAATSHDFWLAFLTPPVWKAIHMTVAPAYALVVAHLAFGALRDQGSLGLGLTVTTSAVALIALHLAARTRDSGSPAADWIEIGDFATIPDGRGIVKRIAGAEAVAIFRDGDSLSAVSNLCAHQNGPLGEGRVIDGCVTCPWHGYQYRITDGRAPAPFTERIATYRLALQGRMVLLDPRPNPPGTPVPPLRLPE